MQLHRMFILLKLFDVLDSCKSGDLHRTRMFELYCRWFNGRTNFRRSTDTTAATR